METMERDPTYIAGQVKYIRKMYRLTQENLADAAGLTTRTIEKIESGRHRPDEQTLRSIARSVKIELAYFEKPTPEQEAQQKKAFEWALRKIILVPTNPIRTASDFLKHFKQHHAFRIDTSAVSDEKALETAAAMSDWITDLDDIWNDCSATQRLEYARSFGELCQDIEEQGFLCHMGNHMQQLREKDRPTLVFSVGLMTLLPKKEAESTRFALIELEGRWETLESERGR